MRFFNKTTVIGIAFGIFCILLFTNSSIPAQAREASSKSIAHLVVPQQLYKAGKVIQGEKITHVFTIKNQDSKTLIIKKITSG